MAPPAETRASSRRELAWYLALTLAASSVFYLLFARSGGLTGAGAGLVPALMWTPGLVAVALQLFFRRSLRGLGWRPGRARFWLVGYLVPLGYALVAYLLIWASPLGDFDATALDRLRERWPWLFFGTLQSCLLALGEELGWRGYLVPRLARLFGFDGIALTSGAIWALWHLPLVLFAGYRSAAPVAYSAACFTVLVVGVSYLFAWLRLRSGSVWPAVLLHGSHNLWIQGFFDRATIDTGPTEYWTGEFGAALALAGVVVALVSRSLARALELPAPRA